MVSSSPVVIAALLNPAISMFRQPGAITHRGSEAGQCQQLLKRFAGEPTHGAVTALRDAGIMTDIHPRAAVCVVRAERQGARLLITLVINADIDHVSRQRLAHFADIDAALDAIRHFLVQFADSSSLNGPSG